MFQRSSDAATASSSAVTATAQSDTVPATTRSRSSSVGVCRGRGRGRATVQARVTWTSWKTLCIQLTHQTQTQMQSVCRTEKPSDWQIQGH